MLTVPWFGMGIFESCTAPVLSHLVFVWTQKHCFSPIGLISTSKYITVYLVVPCFSVKKKVKSRNVFFFPLCRFAATPFRSVQGTTWRWSQRRFRNPSWLRPRPGMWTPVDSWTSSQELTKYRYLKNLMYYYIVHNIVVISYKLI